MSDVFALALEMSDEFHLANGEMSPIHRTDTRYGPTKMWATSFELEFNSTKWRLRSSY